VKHGVADFAGEVADKACERYVSKDYVDAVYNLPLVARSSRLLLSTVRLMGRIEENLEVKCLDAYSRASSVAHQADCMRKVRQEQFLAQACTIWSKLHAAPNPVSFADLQAQLRTLYIEMFQEPVDSLYLTFTETKGQPLRVRSLKVTVKACTIAAGGVERVLTLIERNVDHYLPLEDVTTVEPSSSSSDAQPSDPEKAYLAARCARLPLTVSKRVATRAGKILIVLPTTAYTLACSHIDAALVRSRQTTATLVAALTSLYQSARVRAATTYDAGHAVALQTASSVESSLQAMREMLATLPPLHRARAVAVANVVIAAFEDALRHPRAAAARGGDWAVAKTVEVVEALKARSKAFADAYDTLARLVEKPVAKYFGGVKAKAGNW